MTTSSTAISTNKTQLGKFVKPTIFIVGMLFVFYISFWTSALFSQKVALASLVKSVNYVLFLFIVPFGSYFLFKARGKVVAKSSLKMERLPKTAVIVLFSISMAALIAKIATFVYLTTVMPIQERASIEFIEAIMRLLNPTICACVALALFIQCVNIPKLGGLALPLFILNGSILGLNGLMNRIWYDLSMSGAGAVSHVNKVFLEMVIFVGISLVVYGVTLIVTGKMAKKSKALA